MKDPKEFLDGFPELKDIVRDAQQQIRAIDEQLKQLKNDAPPFPRPTFEGAPAIRPKGTYAHNVSILKQRKNDVQNRCIEDIERRIIHADIETQQNVVSYAKELVGLSDEKEKKEKSLKNKLMDKLPSSKIKAVKEFQGNIPDVTNESKDRERVSITKTLMDSLPSARVKKEMFQENARDLTQEKTDISTELEIE